MSTPIYIAIEDSKRESFDHALSDILCWMDGFVQGGGKYSPDTINCLRDLRDVIRRPLDSAIHEPTRVEKLANIFSNHKNCLRYVKKFGKIASIASPIETIDTDYADRILRHPASFILAVRRWTKAGCK